MVVISWPNCQQDGDSYGDLKNRIFIPEDAPQKVGAAFPRHPEWHVLSLEMWLLQGIYKDTWVWPCTAGERCPMAPLARSRLCGRVGRLSQLLILPPSHTLKFLAAQVLAKQPRTLDKASIQPGTSASALRWVIRRVLVFRGVLHGTACTNRSYLAWIPLLEPGCLKNNFMICGFNYFFKTKIPSQKRICQSLFKAC